MYQVLTTLYRMQVLWKCKANRSVFAVSENLLNLPEGTRVLVVVVLNIKKTD